MSTEEQKTTDASVTQNCFVSRSRCPLCGSENYEEYEELMYEKGVDDAQYGGKLLTVKYGDCRDCG